MPRPACRRRRSTSTARSLRDAFSDLIITDRLLDQLGPALISQKSIFVYGPTGQRQDKPGRADAPRLPRCRADPVRG